MSNANSNMHHEAFERDNRIGTGLIIMVSNGYLKDPGTFKIASRNMLQLYSE